MNEITQSRWVRQIIAWGLRRAVRLARTGHVPQSLRVALRLANLAPSIPVLQLCVAKIALSLSDIDTANKALHVAFGSGQLNRVKYYCVVAKLFLQLNDVDAAWGCLDEAKRAYPTSPRVWTLLGELCRIRGCADEAVRCFDRALTLASSREEQLRALNGLAGCYADTARKDDAKHVYSRMIELAPDATLNYYYLVISQENITSSNDLSKLMIGMLESGHLSEKRRMHLHYALGKVFDCSQQYGEAFAHLALANTIRARYVKQIGEGYIAKEVELRTDIFDSNMITKLSEYGDPDDFLICIVGMPRSGTTLLEQILSSHPDVVGLGERTDFHLLVTGLQARLRSRHRYPLCCRTMSPQDVREISRSIRKQLCQSLGSSSRVVTKMPSDAWEVGLIKILFPNAKIIHSQRHPIDTCLSCFMQNFQFVPFASDLNSLAETYRQHQRIMEHWQNVLPSGAMLSSSYERLVSDPEPVVRDLHDFCGLSYNEDWSEFCNHARRVETASKWQVRRPIYRSSVQKWRNYAAFLGPLLEFKEEWGSYEK